jgi:hypothetical protein
MALDPLHPALADASDRLSGPYGHGAPIDASCPLDRATRRHRSAPSPLDVDQSATKIAGPDRSVRAKSFRPARGIRRCHVGLSYRNVADE